MIVRYVFTLDTDYIKSIKEGILMNALLERETFFICEFITRYIRSLRYNCDKNTLGNIKQITINFSSKENRVYQKYEGTLSCDIIFKYSDIFRLRGEERTKKIIDGVAISTKLIESVDDKLGNHIKDAFKLFKSNSYRNIWIHKKKRIKGLGTARLECELSALEFTLTLIIEDKTKKIYEKDILQTRGDSFAYHHLFNNLSITDNGLCILDRISENPIFTISFDEILNNKKGTYPENDIMENMKLDIVTYKLVEDLKINPRKAAWWHEFVDCYQNYSSNKKCPDIIG